ncbi:EAL domain-containing protein [Massilia agri]|uniref:cyclic-guanylate-specific phosphodiesterase n=1 Tax=Massilia agri TaxID=1886785 RepID=A0ABT2ARS0_9BURK|nr:EAL domain-containing protein [Massilia agri]MCS0598831.1 EAL domain-containing protein [Massilia agri]
MKKTLTVALTVLVAMAGIGLPIWFAIEESERQAYKAESAHALGYARDVVLRADETGRQVFEGFERLAPFRDAPCTPAAIDLMREIDLGSTYIQAVGHVEGNRMLCSSIGGANGALDLGPPTYRSAIGAIVRTGVGFHFAPHKSFIVLQYGSFAAILHAQLPIDTAKSEPDVALAVMPLEFDRPVSVRGRIDPRWAARLGGAREAVFEENGRVIAVVRSRAYQVAGIAAVPMHYLEGRSRDVAARLVPVGLVAGIALTFAIVSLARLQMSLPVALKAALRRKEFILEYQPIVDLRSGRWTGVEALVRWRRPEGEVILPDLFIPLAEQNGLIVKLTQLVLERVCTDTAAFLRAHPDFHVGINVAPADFHAGGFLDSLQHALRQMGARESNLMLEVTERGLLDPVVARETTGLLRRHGFLLAIDDFGTGYSSLSYLESLELDYLKIDRSFIEAIGTGAPTSQVVGHIIGMARDLGLRMIAEGVESQAQADYLRRQGVQYGQGWLFGRPMPFWEIVRHLEDQAAREGGPVRAAG